MSHLFFDTRDWKFILHDQLDLDALLATKPYREFDRETCDGVFEQAVRFAVDRMAAVNGPGDREGCRAENGRVVTPACFEPVWKEVREGGWIAPTRDPEFGGMGLPFTVTAGVAEAFSAAAQAFYMYAGLTSGAAHLIETFGNADLKKRFVAKMYGGEWGGTMCLTEPQAGSAVGDLTTSATPVDGEDGAYLIEGTKIFISGGDASFYGNVVHLVLARRKGDPAGTKGISLFAVPRLDVGPDGKAGAFNNVSVTRIEEKMGIHGSATCQMAFGGDGPCRGYLVGEPCSGLPYMFQMMNEARIMCGVQGIALANAAFQQAVRYAAERKQGPDLENLGGGSVEIIRHPDVRRNLLFMKAWAEGTRALLGQSAWWADMAAACEDAELAAKYQDLLELVTPVIKAYSTDKGFRVTELGIQIFGGYGYTQEYPLEQYMRDAKIASLYEGTNGIQALDLVGRKMRMKGGAVFMTYVMELASFVEANKDVPGLGGVLEKLGRAQQALGEVAFWMQSNGRANVKLAMLQATPFLELLGDIMNGHMLTQQAIIATKKLIAMRGSAEVERAAREDDAELAFLAGKIDTARFFATEVLAFAGAKARAMTSGDTAALDMVF
jgi:alkylation response protein AidB-like acyl-CoA dehydrogenase